MNRDDGFFMCDNCNEISVNKKSFCLKCKKCETCVVRSKLRMKRLKSGHFICNKCKEEKVKCAICLHNKRSYIFIPCGHLCLCKECKNEYIKKFDKCPICKKLFDNIYKVYL